MSHRGYAMHVIYSHILRGHVKQKSAFKHAQHYENTPIQIYWKFHHQKTESFQLKILIFFLFLLKT